MISESRYRALCILRDHPGIKVEEFSRRMWPDSPSWGKREVFRSGRVARSPGGRVLRRGRGFLTTLRNQGLVDRKIHDHVALFHLTSSGARLLEDWTPIYGSREAEPCGS